MSLSNFRNRPSQYGALALGVFAAVSIGAAAAQVPRRDPLADDQRLPTPWDGLPYAPMMTISGVGTASMQIIVENTNHEGSHRGVMMTLAPRFHGPK